MSKNMTRKGISIGAGIALIGSALAGVPANAAITSLSITPILGTSTDTVLGATFNMKMLAPGNATGDAVSFYVEGAKAADLTALKGTHAAVFDSVVTIGTAADVAANSVTGESANSNFVIDTVAGNYVPFSITLNDANVTATTTIKITPFIDNFLANEKPDAGNEIIGNTVSVTFHKASEVTATVTELVPAPIAANSSSINTTAVISLDKNINMADTVGGVGKVQFKRNGGTAVDKTSTDVAYSTVKKAYATSVASSTANMTTFANGDVISAQGFVEGEATGGPVALASVSAGEVASFVGSAFTILPNTSFLGTDGSTTDAVREGSGTVEIQAKVTAESGKSVANQPVTFTVAETANDSIGGATITAGGKTLTDTTSAADKIEVVVNTNASGEAVLSVSYASLDKTETFDVSAQAVGTAVRTIAARTFTATPSVAKVVASNVDGGDAAVASYQMVKGAAGSITYFVRDQFGQVPVGTFRANASVSGGGMAALNSTIAFSGGQATLNWTDNNSAANTSADVGIVLQKLNTSGTYDTVLAANVSGNTDVQVDVLNSAATVNRVTATNSISSPTKLAILKESYVVGDKRLEQSSKDWNTDPTADLTGLVYSSTGGALPGAQVTVSAPGVLFTNEQKTVYSSDSITVTAARDGGYKVFYASNTVGTKTFTVTSGSATTTTATTFDGVAAADVTGISFAGTPTTATSGSTFKVTAKLSDKFGNGVEITSADTPRVKVTYSGPGVVFGTLPTTTTSAGELSFSVLLGSNDVAPANIVVSYDKDGDGDLTEVDGGNIVTQFTVNAAGAASAEYGTVSAWTKNMGDGTAKVYVKFPTVGDKVRIGHQTGGSGSYETIYVKTTSSETMSGLTVVEGVGTYIVRTIDLADISRIRITVGDDVLAQVRYNK